MPKDTPATKQDVPYYLVRKGSNPGCYQLHRPSDCNLKFPVDKRPIHKCGLPPKEKITVPQGVGFRTLVVPSEKPNYYPAVMSKADLEKLRNEAKIITQEEHMSMAAKAHAESVRVAAESEARKLRLKRSLRPQPGQASTGVRDELDGPDQEQYTLSRNEIMKAEAMPGPKTANRIILASKCHAIRDAQCLEKKLIKKELEEEEKRLDSIMEENRVASINRKQAKEDERHRLQLANLAALKEQIKAHENARVMEAERIEEESIRLNQANIAMQIDEAQKLQQKQATQARLKEILDQCNAEILYYKQLQNEEDRIMDLRISNFFKAKQARDDKNRAEAEAIKASKQKGIDHIAKAQKAEQELKEELERIRNLKIQEDVEREYRRKERQAAIHHHQEMRSLHEARNAQIKDIHRMIAREIAKDQQLFNNAARENEESLRKEKELEEKRKREVENHRLQIMKQINDKEKARAELREKLHAEGVALRLEMEQQEQYERSVIRRKVQEMRDQRVPEPYVKEVEQTLAKHGY